MSKTNIFLIMAEDICPNLGCYGDLNARTPRLDEFARENVRYDYCYSAAPVCSAARSSLNIGMYGSTAGVGQHRSLNPLPKEICNIGKYMQDAGYYTAIGKTDFNYPINGGYDVLMSYGSKDTIDFTNDIIKVVDETPKDKPLFIIQTNAITHQSQYGYTNTAIEHRKSMPRLKEEEYQLREDVKTPGYHFDSIDSREIWGQYHEKMTSLDRMFGELIDALKEKGVYEDSIVLFVGDNGHGIPEGKVNLWNEGVHVPMLLHVPKDMENQIDVVEDESGRHCDRLVNFVDFATTFLSIAKADIPQHLEGKAFLGDKKVENPKEVYSFCERADEVFENSRSIHEKDIMYVCDFAWSPYKRLNTYQTTQSPWFVRSMIEEGYKHEITDTDRRSLFRQIPRVEEQLFDLKKDANQLENAFESNKICGIRLRNKMFEYIEKYRDDVLMPEPLMKEFMKNTSLTPYEILQDDKLYPVGRLISIYKDYLDNKELNFVPEHPCEKIIILKYLNDKLNSNIDVAFAKEQISKYLNDESETVRAFAAFLVKDNKTLEGICKETDNFVLLLFITDLIAVWRKEKDLAMGCYNIIVDRYFTKCELKQDDRYDAAMVAAIDMLNVRFGLKGDIVYRSFLADKQKNSFMVMEELDRHN